MSRIKLLNLAHSGAGKTGSLVSLAAAGYRLWIFDYEGGSDIISNLVKAPPPGFDNWKKLTVSDHDCSEIRDINIMRITNAFRAFGGKLVTEATGWGRAKDALANWKAERSEKFWLYTLSDNDIVVTDTLSGLCDLCVDDILALNSRLDAGPRIQDYKAFQNAMDFFLRSISADPENGKGCRAHWIMNCHIASYQEGGETQYKLDKQDNMQKIQTGGKQVGFPKSTGETMSKSLGRHFNNTITLDEKPGLRGSERFFSTRAQGIVRVKSQSPFGVKPEYRIEDGLAKLFEDLRGKPDEK